MGILSKIFGNESTRAIKKINPIVDKINGFEEEMLSLTDKELADKTVVFKERLANGETLDDLLPEAFAVVREASKRVLGLRHYDVQLIGGIVLHQGRIAEMKTGEGKTLVETLPVYLNALEGKGVHVVTVNEYLAKRDSEWMGKVFKFLGLTVGLNLNRLSSDEKRKQYECDVMYTTNNELGFDYLRDNMVVYKEKMVQRSLHYAIIDEIDSILIDEARTPLIISGRSTKSTDLYRVADNFVKTLDKIEVIEEDSKNKELVDDIEKYDYVVDLKAKSATLTSEGIKKAEKYFSLENFNDLENSEIVHNVTQALHAHGIMRNDIDYIVNNGEVLIVDEFTGRIMEGRRYSNGLHQAIEAKEGVTIADESRTLATITFQNFFRTYTKLSGMTGTAMTEEKEFREIYNLDVVEIPTNVPVERIDHPDVILKTEEAKFRGVVEDVKKSYEKGQPVLVGTVSIENSEKLSSLFKKAGLKHEVLNAKNHQKEAEIVAQAGKLGAITIATNMAGRGTDIVLGGNSEHLAKKEMAKYGRTEEEINQATSYFDTEDEEILELRKEFKQYKEKFDKEIKEEKEKVLEAGGLKIVGTERHDSRRIDNQLRGRAGRQGDPGESIFYISLEDDLMQLFGGEMLTNLYTTMKIDEDMPIQMKTVSRSLETAQRRVEGRHYQARKNTLSYDDVMNAQREIIYKERRIVLDGEDIHEKVKKMAKDSVSEYLDVYREEIEEGKVNLNVLKNEIKQSLNIKDVEEFQNEKINFNELKTELENKVEEILDKKSEEFGESFKELERVVLLQVVDDNWMEHLDNMEDLKNGIGLQGYGQKDPVVQYRIEGFNMFEEMNIQIKLNVTKILMHVEEERRAERRESVEITSEGRGQELNGSQAPASNPKSEKAQPIINSEPKIGRNDPCHCGSGKKYKNCHGKSN